jgi:hypothetical protein
MFVNWAYARFFLTSRFLHPAVGHCRRPKVNNTTLVVTVSHAGIVHCTEPVGARANFAWSGGCVRRVGLDRQRVVPTTTTTIMTTTTTTVTTTTTTTSRIAN